MAIHFMVYAMDPSLLRTITKGKQRKEKTFSKTSSEKEHTGPKRDVESI